MNGAGTRAVARIARRTIRRSPWRSVLVAALVGLPVAGIVAGATLVDSAYPTGERRATAWLGAADLLVGQVAPESTESLLRTRLPDGSVVEPIYSRSDELVLPGSRPNVDVRSADLGGLARGMLTLLDGRLPAAPGEAAISPAAAEVAGAGIGDRVTLDAYGPVEVVGFIENPLNFRGMVVLVDPALARQAHAEGSAGWLVGLPAGSGLDAVRFQVDVEADLAAPVGDPDERMFTGTSRAMYGRPSASSALAILVLGTLALVETALVASAAFAVSIRRRQRELGLLSAAGATPRHLAGSVLAESALIGGAGATLGATAGLGMALAASPFLDDIVGQRLDGLRISPQLVVAAVGIGLVAALIAGLAPAWTASRLPTLVALSGRRPPPSPARRMLWVGIGLVVLAFLATSTGATTRLRGSDQTLSDALLVSGAVLGVLGFGASSPWLLERLERPASRLPLFVRIALRDTARARSRNGPIVTAILASFAATVALAGWIASSDAAQAEVWRPDLRPDQLMVLGSEAGLAGPVIAERIGAVAASPVNWAAGAGQSGDAGVEIGTESEGMVWLSIAVGDEDLLDAMGGSAALPTYRAGGLVAFPYLDEATGTSALLHIFSDGGERTVEVPATALSTPASGGMLPGAIISPDTARRLGLHAGLAGGYLLRLDRRVGEDDLRIATEIAGSYSDTFATSIRELDRPGDLFRLAMLAGSLLLALSVTGIAVVLGEAESRGDQRTLLALGAEAGLRRRIAAARAGVLAVLAGVLAVPAGLLTIWGILVSRAQPLIVPAPEVATAVGVLPLVAILGTLLLSRPIPDWAALRQPAS